MHAFPNRIIFTAALTASTLLFPSQSTAVTAPFPVALSGQTTPSGGAYGIFAGLAINNSGQVAFESTVNNSPNIRSIYAGTPGAIQTVALFGAPAPAGGNFGTFSQAYINDSGQVAFMSALTGGTSNSGIFVGTPGSLQAAALQNTAAPAGGNYSGFSFSTLAFNNAGQIAFRAPLTGGSSTEGIFSGVTGSMQAVALQGSISPVGGTYGAKPGYDTFFLNPALNASGQVTFSARLTGATSDNGVFVGTPGSVAPIALQGTSGPTGGTYSGDVGGSNDINASGQVAFGASIAGAFPQAVLLGTPASTQVIVAANEIGPAGQIFNDLGAPVINASGQLAFLAFSTNSEPAAGIYVATPGSLKTLLLQGDPAPSTNGDTFPYLANIGLTMNSSGMVAFGADLAGPGVNSTNDQALFAGTPGNLNLIVRLGDVIDVDPGPGVDDRTVSMISFVPGSGGQDGAVRCLTDSDEIVYRLVFTDGSDGVFTSFVPEPHSAFLLVTFLVLCGPMRNRIKPRTSLLP